MDIEVDDTWLKPVQKPRRRTIARRELVRIHPRGHDVFRARAVLESEHVSDLVESHAVHARVVRTAAVAQLHREDDVRLGEPTICILPPMHQPRPMLWKTVGPAHSNFGAVRGYDEREANRDSALLPGEERFSYGVYVRRAKLRH